MKILVIDDDAISRRLIASGLGRDGYETIEAETAAEAMDILDRGEPVVLVVLDLMLPDMNGLDLLARIRSAPPLEHMPVIICTVGSSREAEQAAATFEIAGFLPKPINASLLRKKVQEVLESEPPPLEDLRHTLERLDLGVNTYLDMLEQWVGTLIETFTEMEEILSAPVPPSLCSRVSALWGAARNFGAARLSRVLARQATLCTLGEMGTAKSLIAEVRRETNILQAEITCLRSESAATNILRGAGVSLVGGRRRVLALHQTLPPSSSDTRDQVPESGKAKRP